AEAGYDAIQEERRAAAPAGGAHIEIGKTSGEERGYLGGNRVGVPQNAMPMALRQMPGQACELVVVGPPVRIQPLVDFARSWICALQVQGFAAERFDGTHRGFALTRVQRRAVGRTIQVDDIASVGRADDGGAQLAEKVI